ncbi:hypothetical protein [Kitasatospora mediocidica]|uniref:hypothetical protein n=1 Tax=Kitasatospora mediocidica TaxID=58352 RepID=UPI00055E613A|nr:hypothetical protein [Kitasatospora mediocidica]
MQDHWSHAPADAAAGPADDRPADEPEYGGEPACLLDRVCPDCGALTEHSPPTRCPRCGATVERA